MNDSPRATEVEAVIDTPQRIPAHLALVTAPSLKPGLQMMQAAAFGQPEACAIRDAYQLRESRATRVIIMSREELDAAFERGLAVIGA